VFRARSYKTVQLQNVDRLSGRQPWAEHAETIDVKTFLRFLLTTRFLRFNVFYFYVFIFKKLENDIRIIKQQNKMTFSFVMQK